MTRKKALAWRRRTEEIAHKKSIPHFRRFEIVVALLGAIIATGALLASILQYQANALQAEVADQQLQPQIIVQSSPKMIADKKITQLPTFDISSDGGPAYDYDIKFFSQYRFGKFTNGLWDTHCFSVPPLFFSSPTLAAKGILDRLLMVQPSLVASEALAYSSEVRELQMPRHDEETILELTYYDALDRKHIQHYLIMGRRVRRLSREIGELAVAAWQRRTSLEAKILGQAMKDRSGSNSAPEEAARILRSSGSLCDWIGAR